MKTLLRYFVTGSRIEARAKLIGAAILCTTFAGAVHTSAGLTGYDLGAANDYGVLFEGNGGHQLQINSGPVNANIGIGGTGAGSFVNPGVINGRVDFAAANTGQYNNTAGGTITSVNYNVNNVTTALSQMNALSLTLGSQASAGTSLAINIGNGQNQTVNASAGNVDAMGNSVFNVTSLNFVNGATLTINGDGVHKVVFDLNFNSHFSGQIVLTGGLTTDDVLFNLYGGAGLVGGDTLQYAANGATLYGIFLDPNGTIQLNSTQLDGRLFGGDSHDMQIVSNGKLTSLSTPVPEPGTLIAGTLLLVPLGFSVLRIVRNKRNEAV